VFGKKPDELLSSDAFWLHREDHFSCHVRVVRRPAAILTAIFAVIEIGRTPEPSRSGGEHPDVQGHDLHREQDERASVEQHRA